MRQELYNSCSADIRTVYMSRVFYEKLWMQRIYRMMGFFLLKIHTYTGTRAFSVYGLITLCRALPHRNITKLLQFSDLAVSCARNYIIVVLQIFAQFTYQEFSMKSYVCNIFTE